MKTIRDLNLRGKRVLMRVDFNVPIEGAGGAITSNLRIVAALPSIRHALDGGASVVLMSHLGRPEGERVARFSLKPVAGELQRLLGRPVTFADDCVGPDVERMASALRPGEILLLENLRFHLEEEVRIKRDGRVVKESPPEKVAVFRASLSRLGDVYVNDAFGAAHRAHSSIVGVSMPEKAAGLLMERELKAFADFLAFPGDRPLTILGGAKVQDKIPLILRLLDFTRELIVAGGMAFTFLKVGKGMKIGDSCYDEEGAEAVAAILDKARDRRVTITYPSDFVCGDRFEKEAATCIVKRSEGISPGWMGLDVGPESRATFGRSIARCSKLFWNGPPGVFEWKAFAGGTRAMAKSVAMATGRGVFTLVGGGDTASAVEHFKMANQVTHCSTGGGTGLELLEGKTLPGVAFLES